MTINQDIDSIIFLRGEQLKNVKEFKYLGTILNYLQPNTGEAELNQPIQLAISLKCLTCYKTYKSTYVFVSLFNVFNKQQQQNYAAHFVRMPSGVTC